MLTPVVCNQRLNALIYPNINDGVYRVAFAKTDELKAEMCANIFRALDEAVIIVVIIVIIIISSSSSSSSSSTYVLLLLL